MTEQRRAAAPVSRLAQAFAVLAGVLLVVPGSSAHPEESPPLAFEATATTVLGGPLQTRSAATAGPDSSHRPSGSELWRSFDVIVGRTPGLLYPGLRVRLPLRFHNAGPVALSVRTATMSAVGPADCPADVNLKLGKRKYRFPTVIQPGKSKTKHIGLRMNKTAVDACQSARFQLTIHATAVRAS